MSYTNDEEIDIVKDIFNKSGINCLPKVQVNIKTNNTDIDIFGVYKNIIILVECVGTDDFGPKIKKAITDFETIETNIEEVIKTGLNRKFRKDNNGLKYQNKVFLKLIVSFNKETIKDIEQNNLSLCKNKHLSIWTLEEMYYFSKISDCTYDHCKFEILSFLKIDPTKIEEGSSETPILTYTAFGKKINENLYILNMIIPVKVLLERTTLNRLHDSSSEKGYQRLLNKDKLMHMRQYLLEEMPLYPNNLICVLNKNAAIQELKGSIESIELKIEKKAKQVSLKKELEDKIFFVEFPNVFNIFEIIDGQHRLFSFAQTKYQYYEDTKNDAHRLKLKKDDKAIIALCNKTNLVVTAIYSTKKEWGEPGKLFFEINTTQTRIKPEDIIDLSEKFLKDSPVAQANILLKKLNKNGILRNKIRVKFWQKDRIKRTSLISYSGLKEIFDKRRKDKHDIFIRLFEKQKHIKIFTDYLFVIINNYFSSIFSLVSKKYKKSINEIKDDLTFKKYYLFSAVFIGALIRLLRHFISDKDKAFKINSLINGVIINSKSGNVVNKNIDNKRLQELFTSGLEEIINKYDFSVHEFNKQEGWGFNKWAKIEADLFYLIRNKYKNFGNKDLISKKI